MTIIFRCLNGITKTMFVGGGPATNLVANSPRKTLAPNSFPCVLSKAQYSRRNSPKYDDNSTVLKSKLHVGDDEARSFTGEGDPNWELLAPRGNRFYLPNAIGPAWQGASTTILLETPLEALIDFDELAGAAERKSNSLLKLSIGVCPSLIKKSLYELFPAPEVVSSDKIGLMTLSFCGDSEQGASIFVLAAREISARLRLRGYWADFMNPFSGKPFYSFVNGKKLFKVDKRFRGLNMQLTNYNQCTFISSEESERKFSGAIYTNAPLKQVKTLIDV